MSKYMKRRKIWPASGGIRSLQGRRHSGYDSDNDAVHITDADLNRVGHNVDAGGRSSALRDEIRTVKANIMARVRHSPTQRGSLGPQIVLVTGAGTGEGKTFIAYNLALSLAIERDMDVTLIDGDIETQGLSRMLNINSEPGLLDCLEQSHGRVSDVLVQSSLPNLKLIASGTPRSHGPELVGSLRLENMLNELKSGNESIVVMDSSGVLKSSSALSLARAAGFFVFVIAAGETRRSDIDASLNALERNTEPITEANAGFVMNKISKSRTSQRQSGR